jgi:hypothetical protein
MTFTRIDVQPEITGPMKPNSETPSKEAGAALTPAPSSEPAAAPSAGDRPSWLPEKFKSPEDMAKAYSELEKKQSGKLDPIQPTASLDFEPYTKEFAETGDISEASIAKIVESGIPVSMVKQYIDGAKALAEQQVNNLTAEIGGREVYTKMLEWAGKSLKPDQIEAYNKSVSTGDIQQQALAIRGLFSQYREAAGPTLLTGKANGSPSQPPFESWAQVKQAMADKRYATDPAYRKVVTERLANSKTL